MNLVAEIISVPLISLSLSAPKRAENRPTMIYFYACA